MTIIEEYRPAPGEAPGNVFTAGSELTLNCMVHGNSGDLTYVWSVSDNPDTTGCTNCVIIDTSSPTSTLTVGDPVLYSYYAGIYTCTVTEDGRPESSGNNDDFTVRVVGKMMIIILYVNQSSFMIYRCWIIC